MKKLLLAAFVFSALLGTVFTVQAAPAKTGQKAVWMTDFKTAQDLARKTGKIMLVEFSGSDWCGWCKKLKDEVLIQKPFLDYAEKNFVLVNLDFPRAGKQTAAQKKANNALLRQYKVNGFPTVLLMNASGKVLASTGYQPGGAEKYVGHLEKLLKK